MPLPEQTFFSTILGFSCPEKELFVKHRPGFILAGMFLILASLACSASGDQPRVNSSQVKFEDDFSKTDSGWDRITDPDGITDYDNGGYRIQVLTPNAELCANPGKNFDDVRIEADAVRQSGPDDNDFGLICRYQDIDNFYYMLITTDGYYGIIKVEKGQMVLLGGKELASSKHIKGGNAINRLRADCVGDTLTLYVNGQQLDSQKDSTFAMGDVGLIAGTYDDPGTNIYFDNFKVFEP
jgi:hypothetical protein